MENIAEVVKKHPVAIGVGVLVLLLLLTKSGSSNTSNSSAGYASAIASTNASNVQISAINASLAAKRTDAASGMYSASVNANTAIALNDTNAFTSMLLGLFKHSETLTALSDQKQVQDAQISAAQATAAAGFDAQVQMHTGDINAKLDALAQTLGFETHQVDTSAQLAQIQMSDNFSLANKSIDVTAANLPIILQSQENVAKIQGDTATQLAVINGQTTQAVAALNTSAARTTASSNASAQTASNWGSYISDAAAIFAAFA